jgi:hypothetical protein
MHRSDCNGELTRIRGVAALCAALLLVASGCGPSSPREADEPANALPSLDDLKPGWNELWPGGRTRCGDGSNWAFLVRRGTVNRVVVEFQRGGACSSEQTCFVDRLAFSDLTPEPDMVGGARNVGIHDHADPRNPFKDWTHVFVPECTGDNHWGDAVQTYGAQEFYHRGAVNALTALHWLYANLSAPDAVFVTGQSAGAYASLTGAALVAHHYPDASVYQLGDSGVGVSAQPGFVAPEWHARRRFPASLGPLADIHSINDLYRAVAAAFPNVMLSEYTSAYDDSAAAQYRYYGGGGVRAWAVAARADLADLQATLPRFASYRAPGWMHTIENQPDFYDVGIGSVHLDAWVSSLMTRAAPASVGCGDDCGGPVFGDSGAPQEWSCLGKPLSHLTPAARHVPAAFMLTDSAGLPASGIVVRACSRTDPYCISPVSRGVTNSLGAAQLLVPTRTSGFRGFLFASGEKDYWDRFYFRPAIRRWWHPWMTGSAWPYATRAVVRKLAKSFGIPVDAGKGALAVLTLDCANSATKEVTVRLDGRPPDGYWDRDWNYVVSSGQIAYFLNLDQGFHNVREIRDGKEVAQGTFFVAPSSFTSVYGLGPGN